MAWLEGWRVRYPIVLDTTPAGADVATDQNGFPVCIHIDNSPSYFWSFVALNGADVRFVDSDGVTLLKHECESFGYSDADAWYWVKVNISGNSVKTIYCYVGNSAATDVSDKENVWNINYELVAHLNKNKAEGAFDDSTSNNHDGTNNGSTDVVAQIDRGRNFDGNADYIDCAGYSTLNNDPVSVIVWINPSTLSDYEGIVSNLDDGPGFPGWALYTQGDGTFGTFLGAHRRGANIINAGEWNQIGFSYDGDELILYLNGNDIRTDNGVTYTGNAGFRIADFYINSVVAARLFGGNVDEVQVFNNKISSDLFKLSYENQKTEQTLVGIGDVEFPLQYNMDDRVRFAPVGWMGADGVIIYDTLETGYDDTALPNYGLANAFDRNPATLTASDTDILDFEVVVDSEDLGLDRLKVNTVALLNTNFRTCKIQAQNWDSTDWAYPNLEIELSADEYTGTISARGQSWLEIATDAWQGGEFAGHYVQITDGTAVGTTYRIITNTRKKLILDATTLETDLVNPGDSFVIFHNRMQEVFQEFNYRYWRLLIEAQDTAEGHFHFGEWDLPFTSPFTENPAAVWDESGEHFTEELEFRSGAKIGVQGGRIRWRRVLPFENVGEATEYEAKLLVQESLLSGLPIWLFMDHLSSPFDFYLLMPVDDGISMNVSMYSPEDGEISSGDLSLEVLSYDD